MIVLTNPYGVDQYFVTENMITWLPVLPDDIAIKPPPGVHSVVFMMDGHEWYVKETVKQICRKRRKVESDETRRGIWNRSCTDTK